MVGGTALGRTPTGGASRREVETRLQFSAGCERTEPRRSDAGLFRGLYGKSTLRSASVNCSGAAVRVEAIKHRRRFHHENSESVVANPKKKRPKRTYLETEVSRPSRDQMKVCAFLAINLDEPTE